MAMVEGSDWRDRLIRGEKGPQALLANAIAALSEAPEWHEVLWHDAFAQRTMARRQPPYRASQQGDQQWTDRDDVLTAEWLQHQGIKVSSQIAYQAADAVAQGRRYHPVCEYLRSLEWDGAPRLDAWISTFLGADASPFIAAAGAKWLLSAVARVFRPGCKVDHVLVLEGRQGILKSTALKILGQPWFTDELAELGSKDSAMQVAGMWILEMSELDAMARGDISKVKAFVTRTVDRFRPPYGRRVVEWPRQCVLAGTVNDATWNRDDTGARRWWPIACKCVDIDGLAEAKDQLWAEALARYDAGELWWLDTDELRAAATEEQAARQAPDAWTTIVEFHVAGRSKVAISDLLRGPLDKRPGDWSRIDEMRLAGILTRMGWTRWRSPRQDDGSRPWFYVAPDNSVPTSNGHDRSGMLL